VVAEREPVSAIALATIELARATPACSVSDESGNHDKDP